MHSLANVYFAQIENCVKNRDPLARITNKNDAPTAARFERNIGEPTRHEQWGEVTHVTDQEFTRLARLYMDAVFRVAYSYLRNQADADDVTQDTLMTLRQHPAEFSSDEHVRNWLIRVAINRCKDQLRAPWRRTEPIDDYENSLAFEEPEDESLFRAVMELDAKYRVPLLLYYREGYAIREIAQMLRVPAATVGTRLARGRKRLKSFFAKGE